MLSAFLDKTFWPVQVVNSAEFDPG